MFEINQEVDYPKRALTAKPAENLIAQKKPFWLWLYQGPLPKESYSFPDQVRFKTDGQRILVLNSSSEIMNVLSNARFFFVAAVICALTMITFIFLGAGGDTFTILLASFIPIFLTISLYYHLKSKKMSFNEFYVFDRNTGNVLLPKKSRCPAYAIPFSEIELYAGRAISPHGMNIYQPFLYPKQRPKGCGNCWRYQFSVDLGVIDEYSAIQHWAFIAQFMDKTQPIPKISTFKEQAAVFKHYNITFDDIPFDGINDDEIDGVLANLDDA